jgi:hypothetical protein
MERIEYDPEGGSYLPVSEHEAGSTLIVAGLIMLIAAAGWALFVGWDIEAGGMLMRSIFGADVLLALSLIALGYVKKKRQID